MKRFIQRSAKAATILALFVATAASAHHSFAMFDFTKAVTITGKVKSFQYTNPHIWLEVMVNDPKTRKTVQWSIEGGSPNNLSRAGWKRSSLKPGDDVTVTLHPLKSGEKVDRSCRLSQVM